MNLQAFHQGKEVAFVGKVTVGGRTVSGPIHVQPGLSNYTLILPLGYGRTQVGNVGKGMGRNFYAARTSTSPHFVTGASLVVTEETVALSNTQEHWSMEGRDIVREANTEEYIGNPAFVRTFGMESHSPSILGVKGEAMSPQSEPRCFLAATLSTKRLNSMAPISGACRST